MVFSFAVNMQDAGGDFQLMLPMASLGSFLVDGSVTVAEFSRKGTMNSRFASKMLVTTFGLELTLPGCKVPATDLLHLTVGQVLQLGLPVRTPAVLTIEGHASFEARSAPDGIAGPSYSTAYRLKQNRNYNMKTQSIFYRLSQRRRRGAFPKTSAAWTVTADDEPTPVPRHSTIDGLM
jgi:hypothetical protein